MTQFQPGAVVNTQSLGTKAENVEVPVLQTRAPTIYDSNYPQGKPWIDGTDNASYVLTSISSFEGTNSANWNNTSGGSGSFSSLTVSGAITAGTTITSTLGNITATDGNFVASTSGTGVVVNPVVVTAAASPQTANGRNVVVTFSGVDIVASGTQAFTITNSSVTALSHQLITWTGATAGSALSIESVVNSAGSSVITMTNSAGGTTSTANITFTVSLLN